MKKTYIAPATRIKCVNEQTSMLAASGTGITFNPDGTGTQKDPTKNPPVDGGSALSKPNMFWEDDNENQ